MWYYLYILPGAFLAPILHEWVKARCSALQGDPTPKKRGFGGNPLKYFEPVGFFLMLMFGYGWGQPVMTSPLHYKNRRAGVLITYIMPSAANLLLGILTIALTSVFYGQVISVSQHLEQTLTMFASMNIGLAVFNLIPVYPLDGARILQLFLPAQTVSSMNRNEKIFQVVLLLLLFFGFAQDFFLQPVTNAIFNLALQAFN